VGVVIPLHFSIRVAPDRSLERRKIEAKKDFEESPSATVQLENVGSLDVPRLRSPRRSRRIGGFKRDTTLSEVRRVSGD
jgi:hypothetical protein